MPPEVPVWHPQNGAYRHQVAPDSSKVSPLTSVWFILIYFFSSLVSGLMTITRREKEAPSGKGGGGSLNPSPFHAWLLLRLCCSFCATRTMALRASSTLLAFFVAFCTPGRGWTGNASLRHKLHKSFKVTPFCFRAMNACRTWGQKRWGVDVVWCGEVYS